MSYLKNSKLKILVILFLIIASITTIAYATEDVDQIAEPESQAILTSEEEENEVSTNLEVSNTVYNDLYIFEDSVTIDYPVSGNVYVMADNVTINSVIDGNVFVLAKTLNIGPKSYVYSDVFACAEKITINGYVYDLYALSDNLTISSDSYIIRDLKASASNLTLNGYIGRNADLSFSNISVNEASAAIGGNLSYSSKSASIPESIVVGEVKFFEGYVEESSAGLIARSYIEDALQVLIIALIVVLVAVYAAPKFVEKEQTILETKLLASLGYGALALIVIPIVCFILFCTVIGIIPALTLLFVYVFVLQISSAIVSIPLGKIICKKMNKDTKVMNVLMSMVSVLVIWVLEQIPVVGGIISLLVAILGLGLVVYYIFHIKSKVKNENIVAEASIVVEPKKEDSKLDEKNSNDK